MTYKKLKELVADMVMTQKETALQIEEDRRESRRELRELRKNLNGIGISIGESAEEFFFRYFKKHRKLGPWEFDRVERNMEPDHGQREYDLALISCHVVVLISIKQKLRHQDILHLQRKELPVFREDYPEFKENQLYGAVAAMVVKEDEENLAKKKGFFVLAQSGERVEEIAPEKNQLKAY